MAVIPVSVLFIFLFVFHFLQIFFRIFQKTECYHYDDGTDRKGCDDADRLQIAHRTFCKEQSNRKQDKQDAPHKLNSFVWLFAVFQSVIAIAGKRLMR